MKFIALKTENGSITGKITFYCRTLDVSKQGFYEYLKNKDKPWKYKDLAAKMICNISKFIDNIAIVCYNFCKELIQK